MININNVLKAIDNFAQATEHAFKVMSKAIKELQETATKQQEEIEKLKAVQNESKH